MLPKFLTGIPVLGIGHAHFIQWSKSKMAANSTVLDRNEEDDPLDTVPLVFHCVGCRTIIGDSLSWVCADQNLRTVSLSGKMLYTISYLDLFADFNSKYLICTLIRCCVYIVYFSGNSVCSCCN